MKTLVVAGAVLAVTLTAAVPANAATLSIGAGAPHSQRLLAAHNAERARVGVAPLRWDPGLAASAASYGPVLERLGRLQHSPKASRPGQRENLWMGSRGAIAPEQMIGNWIAERAFFQPGTFPYVSRTGNWMDVSHYTQLIWQGTTHVGCAIHQTPRWDYLICRYSPPGNVDGRPVGTTLRSAK